MTLFAATKSASGASGPQSARPGVAVPSPLPIAPGTPAERARLRELLDAATAAGLRQARVQGFAAATRPHATEVVHACVALVAFAAALLFGEVGLVALLGAAALAGLRCARSVSFGGLGVLLPRRPCFNLVLRRAGPRTRRVVGGALDRARVLPFLPRVTLGVIAGAVLATFLGPAWQWAAAVSLVGVAIFAHATGLPARASEEGPERRVAESLFAFAERLQREGGDDGDTAVVLSGCASASAAGIVAFCDWWDLPAERIEIVLVDASDTAAEALSRAGFTVRRITSAELH